MVYNMRYIHCTKDQPTCTIITIYQMSTKCTKAKQVPDMSPLTVMSTRWMLDSNSQKQRCKKGFGQVGPRMVGPQTIGCNGQQPPHYFKFQIEGHRSRFILIEFLIPQGSVYCASCFQAFSKSASNLFFCLSASCSLSVRHLLVHSEANQSLHSGELRNTVKRNTVEKTAHRQSDTLSNTCPVCGKLKSACMRAQKYR